MRRYWLFGAFALLLLSGCGNRHQISGKVCGKRMIPAHSETTIRTVMVGDEAMTDPVTTDYSAQYFLGISIYESGDCTDSNEVQVSEAVYDAAKIGSTKFTYLR